MKFSGTRVIGLAVLLAGVTWPIHSQPPGALQASAQVELKPGPASSAAPPAGEVLREIDDPNTGYRWLLIRDSDRPGGPGRMVRLSNAQVEARPEAGAGVSLREGRGQSPPVIRAGDRLIVEESTALVEARLEAVALGSALTGSPLNVRLVLGGNVLRAVALGPGRAAFVPETRARP
jgi:hypothetical protein